MVRLSRVQWPSRRGRYRAPPLADPSVRVLTHSVPHMAGSLWRVMCRRLRVRAGGKSGSKPRSSNRTADFPHPAFSWDHAFAHGRSFVGGLRRSRPYPSHNRLKTAPCATTTRPTTPMTTCRTRLQRGVAAAWKQAFDLDIRSRTLHRTGSNPDFGRRSRPAPVSILLRPQQEDSNSAATASAQQNYRSM